MSSFLGGVYKKSGRGNLRASVPVSDEGVCTEVARRVRAGGLLSFPEPRVQPEAGAWAGKARSILTLLVDLCVFSTQITLSRPLLLGL